MKIIALCRLLAMPAVLGGVTLATVALGAEDPGVRAMQQQQLQRQQQQEALQMRLQQQQRATQSAPAGVEKRQALERLQQSERQQQQQLHYRQAITPAPAQPPDDEGTRQAKAQMELLRAAEDGQQLVQPSGQVREPRPGNDRGEAPVARVPVPPRELAVPAVVAPGRQP
jgi:D-alanyl-D-alanine carboxypeptidase